MILLSLAILFFMALNFFLLQQQTQPRYDFSRIAAIAEAYKNNHSDSGLDDYDRSDFLAYEKPKKAAPEYFTFNPNTLDENGFRRLGFPAWMIRNIMKYRNKGGEYRKKDDFARVYGLEAEDYRKLVPYIDLPETIEYENKYADKRVPAKLKLLIDINTADSALLTELPGIGPAFASRIIKFRNSLGGFSSVEQLLEVYGMDSARYDQVLPRILLSENVTKININTAGYKELSAHPYARGKVAGAIINYRAQHGNYSTTEDIRKIYIIDTKVYEKLLPYITVN
ncbi:MAG: helix-hairpin-helix domain-containing protein [Bacteroidota bacterium]|nr:helix-hairpin-helix domain-containing protein [Bacteroidota bacterium]